MSGNIVKMNNSILNTAIDQLNKMTKSDFVVNSWASRNSDRTKYGLMRVNKDGTQDTILKVEFSKREIFFHIQGYINIASVSLSTKIIPKKGDN